MDEPAEFDGPWKEAIDLYLAEFLAYFFPAAHAGTDWARGYEFLDKELQKVAPDAEAGRGTVDKLVKVWAADGEETWVLIHAEVQSQVDADFARRMFAYNSRLWDRYGRMPVSLAVLGDDRPGWRPAAFAAGRWGCDVSFAYPTAKLLDYRGREAALEADPNPFAALTLAHLKTVETHGAPADRAAWKFRLVTGLYRRGWDRDRIVKLFRLIDWMMTLPPAAAEVFRGELETYEKEQAVPVITQTERLWLEDGVRKGLQQGRVEGEAEGRLTGLHAGIAACLKLKFGPAGQDLLPAVRAVTDPDALAAFLAAIETAPDVDALRARLA